MPSDEDEEDEALPEKLDLPDFTDDTTEDVDQFVEQWQQDHPGCRGEQ